MELPVRKPIRLKDYDYSTPGAYFVTICTADKKCILGKITKGDAFHRPQMILSGIGKIAETELLNIQSHYESVIIDKYVIMPNHIHIIVRLTERINPFPTADIPNIVGKYKAAVTRAVGKAFMPSVSLWQTSFYDHVIRGDADYREIWQYIDTNPDKWTQDRFYGE